MSTLALLVNDVSGVMERFMEECDGPSGPDWPGINPVAPRNGVKAIRGDLVCKKTTTALQTITRFNPRKYQASTRLNPGRVTPLPRSSLCQHSSVEVAFVMPEVVQRPVGQPPEEQRGGVS